MKPHAVLLVLVSCALLSGCATYVAPGDRADFSAFTQPAMQEGFAARPAARLPAGVAFARVQGPRYSNEWMRDHGGGWGAGRFSVVTVREVEDESDFQRIAALPQLNGPIALSTMLLPERLDSETPLRQAASRLQADLLVLYTFDTHFRDRDRDGAAPLTKISLGLAPTRKVTVFVTVSALVIDTRTGFIYAAIDANETRELNSNVWETRRNADLARQEAEKSTFKKLVDQFETTWPRIIALANQTEPG